MKKKEDDKMNTTMLHQVEEGNDAFFGQGD